MDHTHGVVAPYKTRTDIYGPLPAIDRDALIPGVDLLRTPWFGTGREWPMSTYGIFEGHIGGMAILDFPGRGLYLVPAHAIDWAQYLESPLDQWEFDHGYFMGAEAFWDGWHQGTKSQGNIPTPWSRGWAVGFQDARHERARPSSCAPYNETVRNLQRLYPTEYGPLPQPNQRPELEGLVLPLDCVRPGPLDCSSVGVVSCPPPLAQEGSC